MQQELSRVLEIASSDPRVRAIILTGSGIAFCAGADLAAGALDAPDVPVGRHRDGSVLPSTFYIFSELT
jgi:enoyl-CoA hydratase/carnithine racemase